MAQLSDSQLVVLSAACQREDHSVYPLTAKLPGGAAAKVLGSLLNKKMIKEVQAKREDTVWREDKKRGRLTLRVTPAAFEALGIDPKEIKPTEAEKEETGDARTDTIHINDLATSNHPIAKANADSWNSIPAVKRAGTRADSKQAQLIEMLKRPEGASIEEIVTKSGWQPHTVRGAIASCGNVEWNLDRNGRWASERRRFAE